MHFVVRTRIRFIPYTSHAIRPKLGEAEKG